MVSIEYVTQMNTGQRIIMMDRKDDMQGFGRFCVAFESSKGDIHWNLALYSDDIVTVRKWYETTVQEATNAGLIGQKSENDADKFFLKLVKGGKDNG